jgi:hypothetical protein
MSDHVNQVDPDTAQAMREHIRQQFHDAQDGDWVDELTDEEVLAAMDDTYSGGAAGYVSERRAEQYDAEIMDMLPPGTTYAR